MAKRTRTFDPAHPGAAPGPAPKTGEMTVTTTLRGDPDTVKEKMNMNRAPEEPSEATDKDFYDALANSEYQFDVKRILPREWMGQEARLVVYTDSCPMLYSDIVDEVTSHSGGKKYRIRITDPATGKAIAAKTFSVDADPILKKAPEGEMSEEEMIKVLEGKEDESEESFKKIDKVMERQVKMAERRLNMEQVTEMINSLKKKKENGESAPGDSKRIEQIEQMILEERRSRERDREKQESERRISELEAKLNARNAAPAPNTELSAVLAQMQKSQEQMQRAQEASDKRFEAMMAQSREDKANEILKELRSTRGSNGLGTLKEQLEVFGSIANAFGVKIKSKDDEDDDEDEDDEDKPWYERALDRYLPKILDKLDGMKSEGKSVTKEDFMREIEGYAEQAATEAANKEKAKLDKARAAARPALPPPKPAPAPAPAAEAAPPQAPATELPPPAPEKAADAPAPAPTVAPGTPLTIEQETALNVTGVITLIERELQMRRQFYQWNYEGCWENLPEDILEKVCTSVDCIAMFDAFKINGMNAEGIDKLKESITQNPKMVAWLKRGHDELRRWWEEKQKNPNFDPGDEDEAPEEQE